MYIILTLNIHSSDLQLVNFVVSFLQDIFRKIKLQTILKNTQKKEKLFTVLRSTNTDKKSRQQFKFIHFKKSIQIKIQKEHILKIKNLLIFLTKNMLFNIYVDLQLKYIYLGTNY